MKSKQTHQTQNIEFLYVISSSQPQRINVIVSHAFRSARERTHVPLTRLPCADDLAQAAVAEQVRILLECVSPAANRLK